MRFLLFLLFPFSWLYDGVTRVRNLLFDIGILNSQKSKIPTISVGNLRVGGTGKTPMVEYLIRLLKDEYSLSTLSRGYGRKSRGFLKAGDSITASQLGDEPFQIFEKYGGDVQVFVSEKRVLGVENISQDQRKTDLIILDDAYQHRYLTPDLSILLTTWKQPFYKDFLLPVGRLRESRIGAKRADVIVVTKCPSERTSEEEKFIRKGIQKYYKKGTPIFFSSISYGSPRPIFPTAQFSRQVILFSGLADPSGFINYCEKNYSVLESCHFSDHHPYSKSDLEVLHRLAKDHRNENPVFLTTEKDGVKVKSLLPKGYLGEFPIFVLPIEARMEATEEGELMNLIQHKVLGKGEASE
ncbi:MAG: tetraacyldisaccharide 4'-kinase [Algoriphagus sp.]|uniref:tetraacyldisaccharide 4'-kinase n=1 Tax=Algoriphagus sp. TaxID=1872435 RepID=UPI0018451926|nr:tetraacyldisaccharide 4'-kinase [Algoriphagus sp.]NVJ85424.1 tetraacyldisaccharide 4'-kinase [Algoriphagus sp.]